MPLKRELQFLKLTDTDLKELMKELKSTNAPTKAESIMLEVIQENQIFDCRSALKRTLLKLKRCIDAWNNPETLRDPYMKYRSSAKDIMRVIMSQDPV
jgi:hypothetical protein